MLRFLHQSNSLLPSTGNHGSEQIVGVIHHFGYYLGSDSK